MCSTRFTMYRVISKSDHYCYCISVKYKTYLIFILYIVYILSDVFSFIGIKTKHILDGTRRATLEVHCFFGTGFLRFTGLVEIYYGKYNLLFMNVWMYKGNNTFVTKVMIDGKRKLLGMHSMTKENKRIGNKSSS